MELRPLLDSEEKRNVNCWCLTANSKREHTKIPYTTFKMLNIMVTRFKTQGISDNKSSNHTHAQNQAGSLFLF